MGLLKDKDLLRGLTEDINKLQNSIYRCTAPHIMTSEIDSEEIFLLQLIKYTEVLRMIAEEYIENISSVSLSEQYEVLAKKFYEETGIMAPGKDVAQADSSQPSDEDRKKAFDEWRRSYERQI